MSETPILSVQVDDGEAVPKKELGQGYEYDAYDFKRPKRQKRVSKITGKQTKLTEETELQIACVTYYRKRIKVDRALRENTRLYAVSPCDGKLPRHLAILAQRMGKIAGVYDLHFMRKVTHQIPNCFGKFTAEQFQYHWIEVKAAGGYLTDEQEKWWAWLEKTPIKRHVVKSVSDFVKIVEGA